MKLTATQAIEALKLVIPDVQLVDDETTSEYNADSFLTSVDSNREPVISAKITTALKDSITNQVTGAAGSKLRAALRDATGLAIKDFDGLNDVEAVNKAKEHLLATKDQDVATLRSTFETERAAWLQKEADLSGKVSEVETAWKNKFNERETISVLEESIKDIPLTEGLNRTALAKMLHDNIKSSYNPIFDESNRSISLKTKDTGVDAMNAAQNKILGIKDVAQDFFTSIGAIVKDTRNQNAHSKTNQQGQDFNQGKGNAQQQNQVNLPGSEAMDAAMAHMG